MKQPHPNAQLVYPIAWNGEVCGEPFWQWYGNTTDVVAEVAYSQKSCGVLLIPLKP